MALIFMKTAFYKSNNAWAPWYLYEERNGYHLNLMD